MPRRAALEQPRAIEQRAVSEVVSPLLLFIEYARLSLSNEQAVATVGVVY